MNVEFVGESVQKVVKSEVLKLIEEVGSEGEFAVWTRTDMAALTTRGSSKGGPDWSSVVGRVIVDAHSGEVKSRQWKGACWSKHPQVH